jgi:hypothetical protein
VQPLSAAEQQRLDTLEDFWDADLEEQWTKLITAEPRLLDLASEARAGNFGLSDRDAASWINLPEEERKQAAGDALRHGNNLRHRLNQLVGPESGHNDIVLSSRAARDAAWSYLDDLRGNRP